MAIGLHDIKGMKISLHLIMSAGLAVGTYRIDKAVDDCSATSCHRKVVQVPDGETEGASSTYQGHHNLRTGVAK